MSVPAQAPVADSAAKQAKRDILRRLNSKRQSLQALSAAVISTDASATALGLVATPVV
jgi:hypothetical protein